MKASELRIESPCGQDWRAMKPGDKSRFCGECKKHVHDLSAMTKDEARALLAARATEGLCVRYLYDAHGDVVFRDRVPAGMLVRAKRFAAGAVALAIPMSLNACMGAMPAPPRPVAPPPTPSASASAIAPAPSTSARPLQIDPPTRR